MESQLIAGFMLYVDGKPTDVGRSLEEAQQMATRYVAKRNALRIESAVAPAPSQIWNYNHELSAWVERR